MYFGDYGSQITVSGLKPACPSVLHEAHCKSMGGSHVTPAVGLSTVPYSVFTQLLSQSAHFAIVLLGEREHRVFLFFVLSVCVACAFAFRRRFEPQGQIVNIYFLLKKKKKKKKKKYSALI
eukprot:Opistho-2@89375